MSRYPAQILILLIPFVSWASAQGYGQVDFPGPTLMPRYYLGDPRPTLQGRQNKCETGQHQCVDVGFADTCCPNDRYCYVDHAAVTARCCPLEQDCDKTCGSSQYYCPQTTSTVSAGSTVTSLVPACCSRACTSLGFYRCEASAGGQCCPNDHACAGSVCVSTQSTTSAAPRATPLPEGCTTSQNRCDDGLGCCDVWQVCTSLSGAPVCAPGPSITVIGNDDDDDNNGADASLSDGAKAGIGAGVAVGVSAVTASLTWLWLSRRRRARAAAAAQSSGEEEFVEEVYGSPDPRPTGLTRDYFGPDAVAGPLTDHGGLTPGLRDRGVPAQPQAPDDIAVPVEIDSKAVGPAISPHDDAAAPTPLTPPPFVSLTPETPEHRAELYGSEVPAQASPSDETSPIVSPQSEVPSPLKTPP